MSRVCVVSVKAACSQKIRKCKWQPYKEIPTRESGYKRDEIRRGKITMRNPVRQRRSWPWKGEEEPEGMRQKRLRCPQRGEQTACPPCPRCSHQRKNEAGECLWDSDTVSGPLSHTFVNPHRCQLNESPRQSELENQHPQFRRVTSGKDLPPKNAQVKKF